MRASHGFGALIIVGMCAWSVEPNAAQDVRTRATPVEPIGEIADLFDTYDVVAIGEGPHNNLQGHQFRLALIRDPRFRAAATDIIVEFGNSRYQGLMDEFTRGADVPVTSLRRVWQDTVAATPVWESPIYEEFFRAVRAINMSLSEERKLRVLLGDPPIDWDIITSGEELRKWGFARDRHAADVIRREVVDKGRHALMIYGDGHLQGRSERPPRSLAAQLEANGHKGIPEAYVEMRLRRLSIGRPTPVDRLRECPVPQQ